MKTLIKYSVLLILIGSYLACNSPQPVALVEDSDPFEIEVVTNNPTEPTSFGVDSSGVSGNPVRFTNVISVAGIKQTIQGISVKSSFAQAVFFDKANPVRVMNGRLIGYSTLTPGKIFFNSEEAKFRQYRIKYGINRDTVLGFCYRLYNRVGFGDSFNFGFNSKISFRYIPFISPADSVSFDITTPPEIFVNYRLSGQRSNKNLNLLLEWNAGFVKNFEILVSVFDEQRDITFPLYKIKTSDDGKLLMPKKLLEELAVRFDKIIFTLTRKHEKQQGSSISELFVVSQSINSIAVDIP